MAFHLKVLKITSSGPVNVHFELNYSLSSTFTPDTIVWEEKGKGKEPKKKQIGYEMKEKRIKVRNMR